MVFFPNATCLVAEQTTIKNSEGTKIKTFDFSNPLETFRADIQPNNLSQYQIELYGINSKNADTKKCIFDFDSKHMIPGNRVKVVEDSGAEKIYSIQPINKWRFHSEVLLIPVEN